MHARISIETGHLQYRPIIARFAYSCSLHVAFTESDQYKDLIDQSDDQILWAKNLSDWKCINHLRTLENKPVA